MQAHEKCGSIALYSATSRIFLTQLQANQSSVNPIPIPEHKKIVPTETLITVETPTADKRIKPLKFELMSAR